VNIGQFIQEFNGKTGEFMHKFAPADVKMRVKVDVFSDRTFDMSVIGPVTSTLILWKIGQKIGSGEPNKKNI
jgi:ribosomal protein L11